MKKILVLNSGSSSLKYQLFNMDDNTHRVMAKGLAERIGEKDSNLTLKTPDGQVITQNMPLPDHKTTLEQIFRLLIPAVLSDISELSAVGHRLGHGGEYFDKSVLINNNVMEKIYETADLLPLHGHAFILGIEAIKKLLPQMPQTATFDSAFHQSMPKEACMYALPAEQYQKSRTRRYGFHGTSHYYVSQKAVEYLGKSGRFITCHLGNGASVTAVKNGKSIDTSMGFGGVPGIFMGTRCGDIDPFIPLYIMKTQNKSADEVNMMLNKQCGLYALSEGHNDRRDIEALFHQNDPAAVRAMNSYVYQIVKYIGAYTAAMNGVDAIVFTAGIGENSDFIRRRICEKLAWLGVDFDPEANAAVHGFAEITKPNSQVRVLVIPTDEELVIAQDAYKLTL